jgi:polyisoprenoid-binding protein YceI
MRTAALLLIVAVATGGPALADAVSQDPAKAPAGTYELDKAHASLVMKIRHMGFSGYTMRFDSLSGGFTYDPAAWPTTKVSIAIDPRSIDTENAVFNKQVAGWFEPDKYPEVLFNGSGVTGENGKGTMTGELTFHGVTKPVTLDIVFNGSGPGILGAGTRMGFSGTGHIKRSDFGINNMRQFAGDDVDLSFEVEFVKK